MAKTVLNVQAFRDLAPKSLRVVPTHCPHCDHSLLPIANDAELEGIAREWCDFTGQEPTNERLDAFMMGAKLCHSNDGWGHLNKGE